MPITHYYLDVGHSTMPKNNLEKEYAGFLRTFKGFIIKAEDLEVLKNLVVDKQPELNAKHSRCTPLNFQFYNPERQPVIYLSGFCQSFTIRAATLRKIIK